MSFNEESKVKLISNEEIFRIRGNDKLYAEAMESMVKFNKQLLVERKSRIPFLDTQTGIAQSNALLWHDRSLRFKSNKIGQVYKYSIKSWFKNRRSLFDKDIYTSNDTTNTQQQQSQQPVLNESNSNSNLSGSNLTTSVLINNTSNLMNNLQQTIKTANDNEYSTKQNTTALNSNVNSTVLVDDWQDDAYDQYNNYNDENDSDYDDNDDYKPKKSSKKPKMNKNKKSEIVDDKPFTCDKCGAKYKTKPGLNYHIQKAHSLNSTVNSASSSNFSSLKINEILNSDENANSIFDSVYDDMNSSSSLRG